MTQKMKVTVEYLYYPYEGLNYGVPEKATIIIPVDELIASGGDVAEWIQQNEAVQFEWALVSVKLITENDEA